MKKPVLVIMAAGMGSRYGGLKQIDPIDPQGHIIMDFSIFDAKKAGFEEVIFIIKKENEQDFKECIGDRISKIMKEVFGEKLPDTFDDETLTTINKFFENNLNVSETSRQLYIHRNTLVYRLDKLQKMTGLDLRNFDDAIIFKITLMVSKYMMYMDKMVY